MCNVSLIDGHIDEPKKQTNYDRIKVMSIDEMAEFIDGIRQNQTMCGILRIMPINSKEWLESEAEFE